MRPRWSRYALRHRPVLSMLRKLSPRLDDCAEFVERQPHRLTSAPLAQSELAHSLRFGFGSGPKKLSTLFEGPNVGETGVFHVLVGTNARVRVFAP